MLPLGKFGRVYIIISDQKLLWRCPSPLRRLDSSRLVTILVPSWACSHQISDSEVAEVVRPAGVVDVEVSEVDVFADVDRPAGVDGAAGIANSSTDWMFMSRSCTCNY